MLQVIDSLFLIVWLLLPILVILKWKTVQAALFSSAAFYLFGILEGFVLSYLDKNRESFIDHIWFVVGIPVALVYSALIYILIKVFAPKKPQHRKKK